MGFAKIHFRATWKKYKDHIHWSEEASMYFPKEIHHFLRCISERRLKIEITREGKTTFIALTEIDESKGKLNIINGFS
jgi:hypothetical protein